MAAASEHGSFRTPPENSPLFYTNSPQFPVTIPTIEVSIASISRFLSSEPVKRLKMLSIAPKLTRGHQLPARKQNQEALNSFLMAAGALSQSGQLVEAEIRYLDALRTAEKNFGIESDQVMLVASILSSFYRSNYRVEEALAIENRLAAWQMNEPAAPQIEDEPKSLSSLVSSRSTVRPIDEARGLRPPSSLRRACQILGISMEDYLTVASINRAWKKQMLSNGAHPDLGGNTDEAVLLNKAKEELTAYLEERTPKLAAKFKRPAG
jgi:hypothetical protein